MALLNCLYFFIINKQFFYLTNLIKYTLRQTQYQMTHYVKTINQLKIVYKKIKRKFTVGYNSSFFFKKFFIIFKIIKNTF